LQVPVQSPEQHCRSVPQALPLGRHDVARHVPVAVEHSPEQHWAFEVQTAPATPQKIADAQTLPAPQLPVQHSEPAVQFAPESLQLWHVFVPGLQ
jgi:hypothetical protein